MPPSCCTCVRERKFGKLNFELTQALSGHGCFNQYLRKVARRDTESYMYCGGVDNAAHVFFDCTRWHVEKSNCVVGVGLLCEENLVKKMLRNH